jgi:hypothetical protein
VEVKLIQLELPAVHRDKAARVVVDHDRVAVVDDPEAAVLVVEVDRMTGNLLGGLNVDR